MNQFIYPPSPENVDFSKLEPSAAFKKNVGKVVFSIILFFATYVLLIVLSLALAAACVAGCVAIISISPGVLTIMLGLGLLGLGIAVFIFLIKFIFAQTKVDHSNKIEVTKESEPKLFRFIEKLTGETKTPFPKKIFISADVNASVSYNSSFWSMFLPVRKNLEIGLGLVNSINASEFKAVMAHEFGHFSQRSMKLGSFTYNVNMVIYNMLYNNNSYNNFLSSWSNVSGYFAIFASITAGIANGIRSILNEMYKLINKNYLALSREMEFHADAIAASVSGGNNLVSSLNRLELSASCYNSTLEHADRWLKEKKYSANLFPHQLMLLQSLAGDHKLELQNGLPQVSSQFLDSFSRARVNFKNQWASHPTLQERTEHLNSLHLTVAPVEESAWIYFSDPVAIQQQLTDIVYGEAKRGDLSEESQDYFSGWFNGDKNDNLLPDIYQGFYDRHLLSAKDWDIEALSAGQSTKNFEEIFSKENAQIQQAIDFDRSDLETLRHIQSKAIDVKSFDFDGEKIDSKEVEQVIETLNKQIEAKTTELNDLQKEAFKFFQQKQPGDKRLTDAYKQLANLEIKHQQFGNIANAILEKIRPFYQGDNSLDFINRTIYDLKKDEEKDLKNMIGELIQNNLLNSESKDGIMDAAAAFRNKDLAYFYNDGFINEDLQELNRVIFGVDNAIAQYRWKEYKKLLELQLEYYHPSQN